MIYAYDYEVYPVNEIDDGEGNLILPLRRGEPAGMTFVDSDGNYLGYLNLGSGIGSIPSQYVDDGVFVIDLGLITFDEDGSGTPEHDPIGNGVNISEYDLASVAAANTFFSAVAMNADLVESMVGGQFIGVECRYFVSHLNFDEDGNVDVGQLSSELEIELHRMGFRFAPGYEAYTDLKMSYPASYSMEVWVTQKLIDRGEVDPELVIFPGVGNDSAWDPDIEPHDVFVNEGLTIPAPGSYRLYDNASETIDVTFELPDIRTAAKDHLVIPLLEVNIDGEGIVQEISWEYRTPSGALITSPEKLLTDIDIQIEGHDYERLFDFRITDIGTQSYDLSAEYIAWEDINVIGMAYNDIYGLHYVVPFSTPKKVEPHSLVVHELDENDNLVVQFMVDGELNLEPIGGFGENAVLEPTEVEPYYNALETAILAENEEDIKAAALAIGDDILIEYYYMDNGTKVYLEYGEGNRLIKFKYWDRYLWSDDYELDRYPYWLAEPPTTIIDAEKWYRTEWLLTPYLEDLKGKDLHIAVTVINNGALNAVVDSVYIPED